VDAWVINLPDRTDRWRLQRVQGRLHGVQVRRFVASDASEGLRAHPDSPLKGGELGLLVSIDRLLGLTDADAGWFAVMEDDALWLPGLKHRLRTLADALPDSAWVLQAGYLGESSLRPDRTPIQNLRKVLRPRSRVQEWRQGPHTTSGGLFTDRLRAGAQVLLLNPSWAESMSQHITYSLPWDKEIQRWSTEYPGRVLTATRTVAWQVPIRSDIRGRPQRRNRRLPT
jgi:hypothetical protein